MGDNYFLLTNLLSEDERKVITGIAAHIERGEKRVGIQQIANENFLSTTSIVKMCKRLGFDGYSELYYHLSRQLASSGDRKAENLKSLIDNYDDALVERFCALLRERRGGKMFTTGEGFSNIVGTYITQRLSICGFMAFNNVTIILAIPTMVYSFYGMNTLDLPFAEHTWFPSVLSLVLTALVAFILLKYKKK